MIYSPIYSRTTYLFSVLHALHTCYTWILIRLWLDYDQIFNNMSQYVRHRLLQGTLIRGSHSFLSQCQWWGICLRMAFEAWPLLEEIQYSISEKNILLPAFLFFKKDQT